MSMRQVVGALDSPVGDPAAKLVLIALCDNAGGHDDDLAWPSIETLTRRTELSESTVRRKIQYLVDRGQLELVGKHPRTRTLMYRVRPTASVTENVGVTLTPTGFHPDTHVGVTVTDVGVTGTEIGVTVTPEPLRTEHEQERASARTKNTHHQPRPGIEKSSNRGSATGQRSSDALADYERAAAAALPLDETQARARALVERLAGAAGSRA
jgi:hypothetical protein